MPQRRRFTLQPLEHRHLLTGLSISAASVPETESHVIFTLQQDETASEVRRYLFDTVDGTATAGNHYVPVDGLLIEFQPDELTKTVEVELIDDAFRNLDREFYGRVQQLGDSGNAVVASHQRLLPTDGRNVFSFDFDNTGNTLVYSQFLGTTVGLFSVPVDGSSQPTLLADLGFSGGGPGSVQINRATSEVILPGEDSQGNVELFRVPVDGSRDPIVLTHSGDESTLVAYQGVGPDLSHVVYERRIHGSTEIALFSARTDGSTSPVKLFQGDIGSFPFVGISPDGESVVFKGNTFPLPFVVPIDGGSTAQRLSDDLIGASTGLRHTFSPDGQFIYVAARPSEDVRQSDLYRFAVDGSQPPLMLASNVGDSQPQITKDGSRLVFNVNRGLSAAPDLYSVLTDGSEPPVALHPPIEQAGGSLRTYKISDDDQRVVFRSNFDDPAKFALYSVKIDGSESPIKLTSLRSSFNVDLILSTNDPETVVYRTNVGYGSNAPQELYAVDILGNSDPVLLSFEVPDSESFDNYSYVNLHAGGNSLVFTSNREVGDGSVRLFQAPIDSMATPTLLSQPGTRMDDFSIATNILESIHGYAYEIETDGGFGSNRNVVLTKLFESSGARIVDDDTNVVVDDFGDAPTAAETGFRYDYPVMLEDNGARHAVGGLFLGEGVDAEPDGQPHIVAGADGQGGDELDGLADNGIDFLTDLVTSSSDTIATVDVTASGTGRIDAWIDFNRDGDWFDPGEKVLHSVPVSSGDNRISFSIPAGAQAGGTAARFRLSSAGGLGSVGRAADGEVEDYWVTLRDGNDALSNLVVSLDASPLTLDGSAGNLVVGEDGVERFSVPMSAVAGVELVGGSRDQTIEWIAADWTGKTISIDAGEGFDTLVVRPPSSAGDFVPTISLVDSLLPRNVERIDLTSDNALTVTLDHKAIASTADLELAANLAEQIEFVDPEQWRMGAPLVGDGPLRHVNHLDGSRFKVEIPLPWKNVINRFDVNNDGMTTALDALVVINRLAIQAGNELPDPHDVDVWPGAYFDTTGDNLATTLDALFVINEVARIQAGQSAEAEEGIELRHDGVVRIGPRRSALQFVDAFFEMGASMQFEDPASAVHPVRPASTIHVNGDEVLLGPVSENPEFELDEGESDSDPGTQSSLEANLEGQGPFDDKLRACALESGL
ncbi:Protein TolB [Stieleria maiorica]|uniref:Protein TolB n=1 Tax=Stieleria maiorica TaxID=2795974 RepID=A0A5B9MLB4_9BACT|nr:GEVED domain-containing protein [Stieleria maiorica]QEG02162.1 Protein TolB [Stieleria maiorica]